MKAPQNIVSAIASASEAVKVDFSYLLQQAGAESSFDAGAKAKTSSASGLFQFIEKTWMSMVDRYGDKYGIDKNAPKEELLALREDPEVASYMAAEFANENKCYLERNWASEGQEIGSTDLYFAHFLGAGQAAAFLNARDEMPTANAAALFPKAAAANQNVFYERGTGRAKSLDEVYAYFDRKFQMDDVPVPEQTVLATAETQPEALEVASINEAMVRNSIAAINSNSLFNQRIEPLQTVGNAPGSLYNLLYNKLDLMLLTQSDDLSFYSNRSNKGV